MSKASETHGTSPERPTYAYRAWMGAGMKGEREGERERGRRVP